MPSQQLITEETQRIVVKALLDHSLPAIRATIEEHKMAADGLIDLARRVEHLERLIAAMQDRYERDMNILLRAEMEKQSPANSPWGHISTR